MERMPTVCLNGKATVGVGYGDCAGESAGVGERGMPGNGRIAELGRSLVVSRAVSSGSEAAMTSDHDAIREVGLLVVARKRGNARGAKG